MFKILNKAYQLNIVRLTNFKVDKLTQKQAKKQEQEFKKQMQHLANKPSFTLMDYKQRVIDSLSKLKGSVRKKMSQDSQKEEQQLEEEKKILSAIFQEELTGEKPITLRQKKQIALTTSSQMEKIQNLFIKIERQKNLHKLLRNMKENGQALPQSMDELQYYYRKSGIDDQGKNRNKKRYMFEKMHPQYYQKLRGREEIVNSRK